MRNVFQQSKLSGKQAIAEDGRWLICEPAIVADNNDPEKQHRIRVIIPSIDEDLIYDEWVRPAAFCLGNGFGSVFIPPNGSEVLITGTLGQKYNLNYISVYNEENLIPSELNKDIPGIKSPKDLYFIAVQVAKILAQNIEIIAQQNVKIAGQNIDATASQSAKLKGNNTTVEAAAAALLKGNQVQIQGATISISNGDVSIQGGNVTIGGSSVSINAGSVTIKGRPVKSTGPPI